MVIKKKQKKPLTPVNKKVKKKSPAKAITKKVEKPEKIMKKKAVRPGRMLTAEGWKRKMIRLHKTKGKG